MDTKRIHYYDTLKFILITMVVLGHFADVPDSRIMKSIFLFLYAFHMPLFLFIAGQFHKNVRIAQKVVCYLSIYLLCKLAIFALRTAFGKSTTFLLLSEGGVPWFMFTMAAFILATYLLRNVDRRFLLVMSLLLACVSGYDTTIGDALVLSRCIVFYPFYLAGTMLPKEKVLAFTQKKALKPIALLALLLWAYLCIAHFDKLYFLRPLFVGRHPFQKAVDSYGFLYRLLHLAMAVLLGGSVMVLVPHRDMGLLTRLGQRTLQIFFWHRLVVYVFDYCGIAAAICQTRPGKALYLLVPVAVTFLLAAKPFAFPTETVMRFQNASPSSDP